MGAKSRSSVGTVQLSALIFSVLLNLLFWRLAEIKTFDAKIQEFQERGGRILDMRTIRPPIQKPLYIRFLVGNENRLWQAEYRRPTSPEIDGSFPRVLELVKHLDVAGLSLDDQPITDEHMKDIAALNNLEILRLRNTKVTDRGLLQLRDIRGLKDLTVIRTSVTKEGVAALKQHLPNTEIILDASQLGDEYKKGK